MDEDGLIGLLPAPYAVAIRLRRAGAPASTIAVAAGVDESAVTALLQLAEAKLRTLAGETADPVRADADSPDRNPPNPPTADIVETYP